MLYSVCQRISSDTTRVSTLIALASLHGRSRRRGAVAPSFSCYFLSQASGLPSKKLPPAEPPSFVKKLDSIPEIELPPDHPMRVAISLSDRGLVGQFMGLWPSARTTDNWIQRNWRPLIKNSVTCYAVGRGFFIFEFISQEDRDLIFRNGSYFMGTQGLYLNRWTPSFDPAIEVPKDVPVWVRLPNLPIHCWNPSSLQAIGNGLGQYIDRADPKDQYSCV
jgi:hypothetical protein